jgi:hypothetical protein
LMVKALDQIQIRHPLFDLGWLGRLREFFHQGELVSAGFPGTNVPSTGSCVSSLSKRACISRVRVRSMIAASSRLRRLIAPRTSFVNRVSLGTSTFLGPGHRHSARR